MNIHGHEFDAQTEAVLDKVRKLMALAENNDNEHQAEAAANKARELLEAYNLDMAMVDKKTNSFAPRDDQKRRGGLYKWQRDLWNMTASLNFCRYSFYRGLTSGSSYEHRLIGSKVNVISTTIMAQYLQDTIERLAKEWVRTHRPGQSVFIKEAIAYREGIADRLSYRMWDLRQKHVKAEEKRRDEERARNKANGIVTENALVLSDVISTEEDLNTDFVNGWEPGTAAKNRHDYKLRQEAAQRAADELIKKQKEWDEAHPVEAAARHAKEEREYAEQSKAYWDKARKAKQRKETPEEARRKLHSFQQGYAKGDEISLDRQINKDNTRRIE